MLISLHFILSKSALSYQVIFSLLLSIRNTINIVHIDCMSNMYIVHSTLIGYRVSGGIILKNRLSGISEEGFEKSRNWKPR
jgi:hypothetical protein